MVLSSATTGCPPSSAAATSVLMTMPYWFSSSAYMPSDRCAPQKGGELVKGYVPKRSNAIASCAVITNQWQPRENTVDIVAREIQ